MVGTLRFADGLFAQFDSALTMERREVYEVAGTDAWLHVPASFLPGKAPVSFFEHRSGGEVVEHAITGADEYQLMVEHFADCVLNDRELRYSTDEAAAGMRVIEALYESARRGGVAVSVASP